MKSKTSLLVLSTAFAALLGLSACGGTTSSQTSTGNSSTGTSQTAAVSTRTDAIRVLGEIDAHTKASGFTAPTIVDITTKNRKIFIRKATGNKYIFHSNYTEDVLDKSSNITVATGSFYSAYYDDDGKFGALKSVDSVETVIKDDEAGTLKAAADASMNKYLANATYALKFATYLQNFNDDGTANAGGTAGGVATLKSGTYSSTGDGNLTVSIKVHYDKYGGYDEDIVYKWDNYLCVYQKSSDDITYKWKETTSDFLPDDMDAVLDTTIDNGLAIISLI